GGTAPRADRYPGLSAGPPSFARVSPAEVGWAIWNRGRHQRPGRFPVRHARQRLQRVGSARGAESPALACRRAVQPCGKWPGAPALRLSRCRCRARGRALPCRGGPPSGGLETEPTPLRTTEFALPIKEPTSEQAPVQGYEKPAIALPWKAGRFSGQDFALQPDGVLLCPAGKTLRPTEQRREVDGSLRVLYSARI